LCRERGGQAAAVPTDVGLPAECQRLVALTVERYGRVDTLVNNAGITMWGRFEDLQSLDVLEQLMRVNYLGSAYCTYHALPHLRKTRGRLVAISSVAGRTGVPTRSGYAASKHAMTGFFDSLRVELQGSGVTVTVVYPDFVATEIRKRAFGSDGKPLGQSPIHEHRVMTAEECARLSIEAMESRRREAILSARARFGVWLKLVAPGLVDRIARNAIEKGR
jgi:NAD(P)-dependent dehydrogenase (short-subunit alcohol dehydrogenase family)